MIRLSILKVVLAIAVAVAAACSCSKLERYDVKTPLQKGQELIFDPESLNEIHISMTRGQLNTLLLYYALNPRTHQSVHCDVRYVHDGVETVIKDAGIRLRGNTSRRKPYENDRWVHFHIGLNFHKFVKEDSHKLFETKKLVLKYFHEDPTYVREIYSYDLFRRYGVWTAINANYCRLWIKHSGQSAESYLGVYGQMESISQQFLDVRRELFGSAEGNLWKCRYGAKLNSLDVSFGQDVGGDEEYIYELKTDNCEYEAAEAQLKNFIYALNNTPDSQFHDWIASVCDVPLLLKTAAVNVVLGMWDDYWNNGNNFYLYFNSTDPGKYKIFFIPYDYDNTLGTCLNCGVQTDAGRHNPFNWGKTTRPLINRILACEDYRELYRQYLLDLVDPGKDYFNIDSSLERIRKWQNMVVPYVRNDTGEDCVIADRPASWGNHPEYRVTTIGPDNFFTVHTETILRYCSR